MAPASTKNWISRAARLGRCVAWSALAAAITLARAAHAEGGFALDRFQPAPAGDRFLGVPSPYVAGDLDVHAMLLVDYAHRPLLLQSPGGAATALLAHQGVVHVDATLALARRVLVNVDVPVVSIQSGDFEPVAHAVDFGDLRIGARARLFGADASPFQLGAGGHFWIPTGTGPYVTDGKARGMPYLTAGGLVGPVLWSCMAGAELRYAQRFLGAVQEGSSFEAGAGAAFLAGAARQIQLGAEVSTSFVLAHPSRASLDVEVLFHGRFRFLDVFELGAGVGPGLTSGVGAPEVRVLGLFAYVPVVELNQPRPATLDPEPNPGEAGLPSPVDKVPAVEPPHPGAAAPPEVHAKIAGDEIVTSGDGIHFEVGSAEISESSAEAIHAIADFLVDHPEIRKVEIRGYTDIHGTLQRNEQLSNQRAERVREALVLHSVAPERLKVRAYGPKSPIEPSTTDEGMKKNRRVEVWIVARAAKAKSPPRQPNPSPPPQ